MAKIIKKYTQFMESAKSYNNKFKFSEVYDKVIVLLNQDLEQEQRDKLIYILNVLYSSGTFCWDGSGKLIDHSVVDEDDEEYYFYSNSPRDVLDDNDEDMDALSNFYTITNGLILEQDFNSFQYLIKNGTQLTDYEKRSLKKNKTFDEWVDLLMDKEYAYTYKSRRDVSDHLLCVIGNGYGWNSEGYIESKSEAKTDWKNAKLPANIQKELDDIFSIYEVELTYETYREDIVKRNNKRKEEDRKTAELFAKFDKLRKSVDSDYDYDEFDSYNKKGYSKYYPISSSSDIYVIVDKESQKRSNLFNIHPSYIKAAKEICEDIMAHKDEEEKGNVEFAIKALAYFGDENYKKMLPKTYDKYEILDDLKMIFADVLDYGNGEVTLDDTAKNQYGSNNYTVNATFNSIKEGSSVDIEFLKGTPIYYDLKTAFNRMMDIEGIYYHTFYFYNNKIFIDIIANEKYVKSTKLEQKSNENFEKLGFEVGLYSISLYLDKLDTTLTIRRPKPMDHMPEKGGYYSNALYMDVKKGSHLYKFNIDERNFNSIYLGTTNSNDFTKWVLEEHENMKKSDPKYGYGKREGQACLYAHDFMLWLKDNQDNYKNEN